jgi:hypothetical protein
MPSDELSLLVSAKHSYFLAIDNISHISDAQSDYLCRLSSGGSSSRRKLFSDADISTVAACRGVILTGIEDFVVRGDLLSRCITVELAPPASRMTEEAFKAKFREQLPCLMGATLNALSAILRTYDTNASVEGVPNCRNNDALLWVEAGSEALGWEPGTFLRAYKHNLARGADLALEACPFLPALLGVLRKGRFTGTCSELLEALKREADWETQKAPGFVKTPRQLSNALRRLQPNLKSAAGIEIERERGTDRERSRLVRIWQAGGGGPQPKTDDEKDVVPF